MTVQTVREYIKFDKTRLALKWISLSTLVGITIGLLTVLFEIALIYLTDWVNSFTIWIILLFPIVGLFISGFITGTFAPEARGHGTDAIINAYHHKWGIVKPRVIGAKLSASLATLGFGGSAGRSGPTIQMGGGISSLMGVPLKLSLRERGTLTLCGISASFGAIFGAPLSGAIFACEVVYRDEFEYVYLLPCAISSVVGYVTYQLVFSAFFGHVEKLINFQSIDYTFDWAHIVIFLAIGMICGLIGLVYIKFFYYIVRKSESWRKPEWLKTVIGGIAVTLLALLFTIVAINFGGDIGKTKFILGLGWNLVNQLVANETALLNFSLLFLILILIFKILTTSATIGSGGSGGVVAPSLAIGAVTGGIVALILAPFVNFDSRVIIGVSCIVMFASIAHIPLTGMMMGGEMFGIAFIVPTLLASVVGSWVAAGDSIYHSSLVSKEQALKIYRKFKEIR